MVKLASLKLKNRETFNDQNVNHMFIVLSQQLSIKLLLAQKPFNL
jgi:hypothetical protein